MALLYPSFRTTYGAIWYQLMFVNAANNVFSCSINRYLCADCSCLNEILPVCCALLPMHMPLCIVCKFILFFSPHLLYIIITFFFLPFYWSEWIQTVVYFCIYLFIYLLFIYLFVSGNCISIFINLFRTLFVWFMYSFIYLFEIASSSFFFFGGGEGFWNSSKLCIWE